jgi:polyisoprenoid-binding protein YceI
MQDGSAAFYRVTEQLAGVNFPNDAIGTTPAVTGTIALNADGTVNSAASKVTIDLRMLKSDQEMRDGYLQKRTLDTDKFPTAVFVPKTLAGVASPFPNNGQAGLQLTGDLTVHGTTAPERGKESPRSIKMAPPAARQLISPLLPSDSRSRHSRFCSASTTKLTST